MQPVLDEIYTFQLNRLPFGQHYGQKLSVCASDVFSKTVGRNENGKRFVQGLYKEENFTANTQFTPS